MHVGVQLLSDFIVMTCRWGQTPQQPHPQHQSFYSRTFSLPAVDGRLPEILFSGGDHPEPEVIAPDVAPAATFGGEPTATKSAPSPLKASRPLLDGFKCPRCAKFFASFAALKEHVEVAHKETSGSQTQQQQQQQQKQTTRTKVVKYRKGTVTAMQSWKA